MPAATFFGKGALADEAAGSVIGAGAGMTFPASIADKDIAVMGVGCGGASAVTFTTPSSQGAWQILGTTLSSAGMSTEWYWLRLAGTEGPETVTTATTFGGTNGGYGQIWVFRGAISTGNPFEGVGNAGTVSTATPTSTAVTTTDTDRLVVCILAGDDDPDFASGFPPGGWSDMGGLNQTTIGSDWMTRAIQRTEASATTVASATVGTWAASKRWRTLSFALIPEPPATPSLPPRSRRKVVQGLTQRQAIYSAAA